MEPSTGQAEPEESEWRVVVSSRRYFIAEDDIGFMVADHANPDEELGRYPGTYEGYSDAEQQYRALNRRGRTLERSLAMGLSILAGIGVAAWAATYVLEEFTFNPLRHPFQDNLPNLQVILSEIELAAYRIWVAALVGIVILAIRAYLSQGLNKTGLEYRSHLTPGRNTRPDSD